MFRHFKVPPPQKKKYGIGNAFFGQKNKILSCSKFQQEIQGVLNQYSLPKLQLLANNARSILSLQVSCITRNRV